MTSNGKGKVKARALDRLCQQGDNGLSGLTNSMAVENCGADIICPSKTLWS